MARSLAVWAVSRTGTANAITPPHEVGPAVAARSLLPLVLALLLACAAPGQAVEGGATLTLAADASGPYVSVHVTQRGGTSQTVVAAILHDEADGPAVDRLQPLGLVPGETTHAVVSGVLPGVPQQVRILPGPLDPYTSPGGRANRTAVLAATPLAQATVPARLAAGTPQALADQFVPQDEHMWGSRMLLLPGDGLAVAWMSMNQTPPVGLGLNTLRVAVSHDGGRTFGAPVTVSSGMDADRSRWSWVPGPDGTILFAFRDFRGPHTNRTQVDGGSLVRVDPATGSVNRRPLAPGLTLEGPSSMALDAAGRILMATVGANGSWHPQLWRVAWGQDVALLQTMDGATSNPYYGPIDLQVKGPWGLLAWTINDPFHHDTNASAWFSRSVDGGATFGPAWSPDLGPLASHLEYPLAMGDDGTVHFIAQRAPLLVDNATGAVMYDHDNQTSFYGRLAPNATVPALRDLSGSAADRVFPSLRTQDAWLTVAGRSVLVAVQDFERFQGGGGHLTHLAAVSRDGGDTFAPAMAPVRGPGTTIVWIRQLQGAGDRFYVLHEPWAGDEVRVSLSLLSDPLPPGGQLVLLSRGPAPALPASSPSGSASTTTTTAASTSPTSTDPSTSPASVPTSATVTSTPAETSATSPDPAPQASKLEAVDQDGALHDVPAAGAPVAALVVALAVVLGRRLA